MIVGVPRETYPGERRVALVPAVIAGLLKAGLEVVVEADAGMAAGHRDEDYRSKGAKIAAGRADVFKTADVIAQVLGVGANDKTGEADLSLRRHRGRRCACRFARRRALRLASPRDWSM